MSASTGLDGDALIKEVRENMARLSGCQGPHDFQPSVRYESGLVKKYLCSKCQGVVGASEHVWYERGMAHGSRVTFFEDKDGVQIVELSTRRYHMRGDKLIELHLHGQDPVKWVPSSREWPLKDVIIKTTAAV